MTQEIVDAVREIEREKGIETGTLVAADDHAVTVSVHGTAHQIPVDEIVRGNLIDEDGAE